MRRTHKHRQLIDACRAADLLGLDQVQLDLLIRTGKLRELRQGGGWGVDKSDVDRMLRLVRWANQENSIGKNRSN